jgi:hypothetical protein
MKGSSAMSKNSAIQTATVQTTAEPKKDTKKSVKLFGLSKDEMSLVVGGTGVILGGPKP